MKNLQIEQLKIGFEIEYFDDLLDAAVADTLYNAGIIVYVGDYSVDGEINVDVVPSSDDIPTLTALLLLLSKLRVWDDDRSTGNHVHISVDDWDCSRYKQLFDYSARVLWLLSPFFLVRSRRDGDVIIVEWTEERSEWARTPGYFDDYVSDVGGECRVYRRPYWAVAPNPAGGRKPFTLEYRLCETWPGYCTAGIYYILAGFEAGVTPEKVGVSVPEWYTDVISVDDFKRFIEAVEAANPGAVPGFARRIARLLLTGEKFDPYYETKKTVELFEEEITAMRREILARIAEMLRLPRAAKRTKVGNLIVYIGDGIVYQGHVPRNLARLIKTIETWRTEQQAVPNVNALMTATIIA